MSRPLSAVLCGAGNRGLDGYGWCASKRQELLEIVAVAEPLPSRRAVAVERHAIEPARVFRDWAELAKAEKVAEVAIVATPDREHVEPALSLLARGYHVLLEKPMALSLADCWRLVEAAESSGRFLVVGHVLRYSPYFRAVKAFLQSGKLGDVMTVRHLEPVNFWRFCHSFVRGNWSVAGLSAPFIMAKSCHDFDLLYYLLEKRCMRVSSFGSLKHFRTEHRPAGATSRCCDCPLAESECAFSATRYYGDLLRAGEHGWPVNVVTSDFTEQALAEALADGPYGRCIYDCPNDVVDHQVAIMEFEEGVTATFTATAFTDHRVRETEIHGSLGTLKGDGRFLEFSDFRTREVERWEVPTRGRHLGGDWAMLESFQRAVRTGDASLLDTGPRDSLVSHAIALAVEESRLKGRVVEVDYAQDGL